MHAAPLTQDDQAFDPNCFDFVEYVARQHGLRRREASALVQRWLLAYEPSEAAKRAMGHAADREAPPASGVHQVVVAPDLLRTGTNG
jgi:hypothetical protein